MKKSNSGEIIVRILCFALGVLLTVSAVLIRDRFFTGAKNSVESEVTNTEVTEEKQEEVKKVEAVISPIAPIDDENTIGDSHVEVAELEKYEEEVTQKLAELKDQPVLTENDDVSNSDILASNSFLSVNCCCVYVKYCIYFISFYQIYIGFLWF